MSAVDEPTRVEQAIELALMLHIVSRCPVHLTGPMWIYEMAGKAGTQSEIEAATRALDSLLRQGLVHEDGELIVPTEAGRDVLA